MIERVIFTPEADDDVAGSYDWYEPRAWLGRRLSSLG